jgi:hypothetical protein
MKAISNLKIDKVVVWGGTESGKSGISSLFLIFRYSKKCRTSQTNA